MAKPNKKPHTDKIQKSHGATKSAKAAKHQNDEADSSVDNINTAAGITSDAPIHTLHLWQFQALRDSAIILGIVIIIWFGYWIRSVTVPLLIALTLAYLVEPLVARLCKKYNITRPLVVGGMLVFLGILFLVFLSIIPLIIAQFIHLLTATPAYIENMLTTAKPYLYHDGAAEITASNPEMYNNVIVTWIRENYGPLLYAYDENSLSLSTTVAQWIQENVGALFQATIASTGDAISFIGNIIGSTIYLAFALFLIPFYFFFFSTAYGQLQDYFTDMFPEEHAPLVYDLARKMDFAVSGFVRGRIVISVIMGIMLSIGWGICGVPYWLIVGMITGILCAVPYLGGIGIPGAILLLWLKQQGLADEQQMAWWGIILWPTLVFAIIQLFEGYILTPVIAGKATNLGPVSILVAVLAGGVVMGMYGMLLAIPLAACLKILSTEVLVPRIKAWAAGKARDILPISAE